MQQASVGDAQLLVVSPGAERATVPAPSAGMDGLCVLLAIKILVCLAGVRRR
jgi:hypothetical protein